MILRKPRSVGCIDDNWLFNLNDIERTSCDVISDSFVVEKYKNVISTVLQK